MSVRLAVSLAVLVGVLGLGLRAAVPVRPVDEPFRAVIRFYNAIDAPAR